MSLYCKMCGQENKDESKECEKCLNPLHDYPGNKPLSPDTILEKRYKIINLIKTGGMGAVYKILDMKLNTICALKELRINYEDEDHLSAVEWFKREASIMARVTHPHVPRVFDYFSSNDQHYLAMTFIEGDELEAILKKEGTPGLPEEKVIYWAIQILDILEYLHNQDPPIVYRDIKPSNIMINKNNEITLVDFGLARMVHPDSNATKTCIGTPAFAPVEMFKGKPVPKSDIYSLGASMHYLLTGVYPYPFYFESMRDNNPNISEELDSIVMRALDKGILNRPDAREMREELKQFYNKNFGKEINNVVKKETINVIKKGKKNVVKKVETSPVRKPQRIKTLLVPLLLFLLIFISAFILLPGILSRKGIILSQKGKYNESLSCFNKALLINRNYKTALEGKKDVFKVRGDECLKKYNYDEALVYYTEALRVIPDDSEVRYKMANILDFQKKYDEALKLYDKCFTVKDKYAGALFNSGIIFFKQGKYKEASECFNKFCLLDNKTISYFNVNSRDNNGWAPLHMAVRMNNKKLAEFLISIKADINSKDKEGKIPEHYADTEEMKQLFSANAGTEGYKEELQGEIKDFKEKAETLAENGQFKEALTYYDKILKVNPGLITIWNAKGDLLFKLGKYNESIICCDKIIKLAPESALAWYKKGKSLGAKGNFDKAVTCFNKSLTINEENRDAWNGLGTVLYMEKKYSEAIQCYNRALAIDPSFIKALDNKGLSLYSQGKYEEAMKCFDMVLNIDPLYIKTLVNKGNVLYGQKNYEEAIKYYDRALEIDPDYTLARFNKESAIKFLKH